MSKPASTVAEVKHLKLQLEEHAKVCTAAMDAYEQREKKLREALEKAKELRREIYLATPVRDDTRDAHFALEQMSILLHKAAAQ